MNTPAEERSSTRRVLKHLAFGTFFYLVTIILAGQGQQLEKGLWFAAGKVTICLGIGYYLSYRWIPTYMRAGWTRVAIGQLILTLLAGIFLLRAYSTYIYFPRYPVPWPDHFWYLPSFLFEAVNYYTILFPIVAILQARTWIRSQKLNHRLREQNLLLEKEKLYNELQYLKHQINPHFFFNTLNNLYGLALTKSDATPDVIVKLSDIMRYLLHGSDKEWVQLEDEIKWMQAYLDLEKIRHDDKVSLSFKTELMHTGIEVPPLILLHFLENSFKHGVRDNIGKSFVHVLVRDDAEWLHFKVENSLSEVAKNNGEDQPLGLKNIRRRLDLLFDNRYDLQVRQESESFIVDLRMPLSVK